MASRTSLAELQSTVTALQCADQKTEVLDSLLSMPAHTWVVANKDKLQMKEDCQSTTRVST